MIIIDCSDYGPVAPWIETAESLSGYLDFAQHMIDTHDPAWLNNWVERWTMSLAWASVRETPVGEDWYSRCMLLQAVEGLLGRRSPKCQVISY